MTWELPVGVFIFVMGLAIGYWMRGKDNEVKQ